MNLKGKLTRINLQESMFASRLSKCPFMKNSTNNPFTSGAKAVSMAKSVCPFVKKNYSAMVHPNQAL